jgi:hypothetical protein
MKVVFRNSFLQDIKKLKSKTTIDLIHSVIENCEKALIIAEIKNCWP